MLIINGLAYTGNHYSTLGENMSRSKRIIKEMNILLPIVRDLESVEFGLSTDYGNGIVSTIGDKIVVKIPSLYDLQLLDTIQDDWVKSDGKHAKYFVDKYNIIGFKLIGKRFIEKPLLGSPAHIELVMEVVS